MDDRRNLMVVTGVLFFDDPVPYDELKERFEDRLTRFDRFRQRLVEPRLGTRPRWEEDPQFDVENHLTHVALPEPQGPEELQRFVADKMDDRLDDSKPLWHCWLVEGVGEGNALVVRIHHALADGFALLYVLFGLSDNPEEIELPIGELPPLPGEEKGAVRSDRDTDDKTGLGIDPFSVGESVVRGFTDVVETRARSLPLRKDPETPLRGELSGSKSVSWTETYDLDDVKSAADSYDATVNDVLMASMAGAFRRYIEEREGEVPKDLELTTAMPVNLKPLAERDEQLGNYFGLGFIELPVGVENYADRIRLLQKRTGVAKQGAEAYGMYALFNLAGSVPRLVQDTAAKAFRERITAAVTNVPGPVNNFEIAGSEVTDIMFWAPTTEDIGVGISLFSYGGEVRIGVAVDDNVVADVDTLADAFESEMREMLGRKGY